MPNNQGNTASTASEKKKSEQNKENVEMNNATAELKEAHINASTQVQAAKQKKN